VTGSSGLGTLMPTTLLTILSCWISRSIKLPQSALDGDPRTDVVTVIAHAATVRVCGAPSLPIPRLQLLSQHADWGTRYDWHSGVGALREQPRFGTSPQARRRRRVERSALPADSCGPPEHTRRSNVGRRYSVAGGISIFVSAYGWTRIVAATSDITGRLEARRPI
jgi:hypothetical protein